MTTRQLISFDTGTTVRIVLTLSCSNNNNNDSTGKKKSEDKIISKIWQSKDLELSFRI